MLGPRPPPLSDAASNYSHRNLLAGVRSDFLINMHHCFQDEDTCYIVMDLMLGGDLRFHMVGACGGRASRRARYMASRQRDRERFRENASFAPPGRRRVSGQQG